MSDWIACVVALPPNGLEVMTKIDDGKGCRNEQTLKRQGALWFFTNYEMYVYYRPTHWKEVAPAGDPKPGD